MTSTMIAVFASLLSLSAVVRADESDPEYQTCAKFGSDEVNFISCLTRAAGDWDRKANKIYGETTMKAKGEDKKAFMDLVRPMRKARFAKCGAQASTVVIAECQRATAKSQYAEIEKAAASISK